MQAESSGSIKTLELLAWLEANARKLALGAAIVAVVAGVVFFLKYQRGQRESAATEALSLTRAQAGRSGPSAVDLRKVQSSFAGTMAARQAGFLAAGALFAEGKFAEARAEFDQFTRDHATDPLAPQAALGVAACLESEKNLEGALAAYQGVLAKHPNDGVAIQAKLAIGRIQEAKGQHAEAFKLYQETTRSGTLSAWHADFAARRDELLRRFPQLAVTNAPAPAAVNIPGTTPDPALEKK
jgi:predicted negative regulator of RcsB-dependent stress response